MAINAQTLLSFVVFISVQTVVCLANGGNAVVVVGTLGATVQLPSPRGLSPEIDSVKWTHKSTAQKLAEYHKGKTEYYGTEEMRKRVTVHRENLTLQISDLRRTDTGDYRIVTDLQDGKSYEILYNLTVYERVSGVEITSSLTKGQCNGTLTCDVKSGKPVRFVWERDTVNLSISQPSDRASLSVTLSSNHSYTVFKCKASNPVSDDSTEISFQPRDYCVTSPDARTLRAHSALIAVGVSVPITVLAVIIIIGFKISKKKRRNAADPSPPSVYCNITSTEAKQSQKREESIYTGLGEHANDTYESLESGKYRK
ncbi:uncharacterized protein LOC103173067 [Callorhinchus milii]|uniref:uncharacterized protein LOC103173067 n=1 Tax=Callorhinchus milii TaxID=7868 RepID=UPI001C3FA5EE|nr:uncharacterized protein LOC103173067 [Callorhinchus milii]